MKIESNIRKLIWTHALWKAQFHQVVFALFLLSKGFSLQQFFLALAVGGIVSLIMEVPTGMLSDRISKKLSLVLALVIHIPLTFVMIVSDSFPVVLAMFAISGISGALMSGTDTALLYETLKSLGRESEFKVIRGKQKWVGAWAGGLASITGGLLAKFGLAYAWWAWFLVGIPVLFIHLALVDVPVHAEDRPSNYLSHLKESFSMSLRGDASYFILYSVIIGFFFSINYWLWQPYLELTGLSLVYFGIVYAVIDILSGFVSKHADWVEKALGMRKSLLLIPLVFALGLILQSQVVFVAGGVFLLFHVLAGGVFGPILDDYVNSRIPSAKRATILSINNMLGAFLFVVISPLVGKLIDMASLQLVLGLMSLIIFIAGLVFFLVYHRRPTDR